MYSWEWGMENEEWEKDQREQDMHTLSGNIYQLYIYIHTYTYMSTCDVISEQTKISVA